MRITQNKALMSFLSGAMVPVMIIGLAMFFTAGGYLIGPLVLPTFKQLGPVGWLGIGALLTAIAAIVGPWAHKRER